MIHFYHVKVMKKQKLLINLKMMIKIYNNMLKVLLKIYQKMQLRKFKQKI